MRIAAKARRAGAAALPVEFEATSLLQCISVLNEFPKGLRCVAGYRAIRDELNIDTLLEALHAQGVKLTLPVTLPGPSLIFRDWAPGDPLDTKPFGLREPAPDKAQVAPIVILVPLLAFDRQGNRVGYGAGYYDAGLRTLRAQQKIAAIGVAFDEQEVPVVPHHDQDERLDYMLTPTRFFRCET